MTAWEEIERVFEEAEKLKALKELYMERGNVTHDQARAWALEKYNTMKGEV